MIEPFRSSGTTLGDRIFAAVPMVNNCSFIAPAPAAPAIAALIENSRKTPKNGATDPWLKFWPR
ncbi:hypothetical protein [Sphingomonas nostoxanthinifaciens]|uniref:hypothetical protein n=1 Tax=Sphingomonas nostoxanthinifaciens TaxID=2872652 RepID=UPI001CC21989|nr:hypothetical protein [Sphingomonas nostoxanthinifaciens]UAK25224.1 hypothetical protein K8P63_03225 [Sphingomonas nostoxanthinifaciens]